MKSEKMTTRERVSTGIIVSAIAGLAIFGIRENDKRTHASDFASEVNNLSVCLSRRAADILRGGNEKQPSSQHTNVAFQIAYCDRAEQNQPNSRHGFKGSAVANDEMHNCLDDRVDDIYEANTRASGIQEVRNIIQRCALHVQENFDTDRLGRSETVRMPEGRFGR